MLKNIIKKQQPNIDREAFDALHKEMLKAMSVNLAGQQLFDAKKYGEMSRVKFSEDGIPEDVIVTVKKEVCGKIVHEEMSVKNSTAEELRKAFIENDRLS